MENVTHLWNAVNFLTKFDAKNVNDLRTYYIQCCRQLGNTVKLPKECFGASTMCSHCGSLWSKVKHRNRVIPGKTCSNAVKKIIRIVENDGWLPKYRLSLARKYIRSSMNKMSIKCFACSKTTEIPCKKTSQPKSVNRVSLSNIEAERSGKKKKRHSRDKRAGLNISSEGSFVKSQPDVETGTRSPSICKNSSPLYREKKKPEKPVTPFEKLKKMNKEKLSNILKDDSAKKRNSLSNFLKELY